MTKMPIKITLLLSLATLAQIPDASSDGDCTWTQFGMCYTLVLEKLNFMTAEAVCQNMYNGHLVSVSMIVKIKYQ